MERKYYTLIASLPHLPRFDRTEKLPINRERLRERLQMLSSEDDSIIKQAVSFISWQQQPVTLADAEIIAHYRQLYEQLPVRIVRLIEIRVEVRTIIAALRRRKRGLAPDGPWGIGRWVEHIERHWQHPDFHLAPYCPWLPEARNHMELGASLELERLAMATTWRKLDKTMIGRQFTLDEILAYLLKWDLVARWLSYRAEIARERFTHLVTEVSIDYDDAND